MQITAKGFIASGFLKGWKRKLGLFVFLVIIISGVIYNVVFNEKFLEKQIKKVFAASTNGAIDLNIRQSSLFRGFIIENIVLKSGAAFDNKPIVKIEKFTLLYSLYGFFVGDFGVHELGIYNPEISLVQKDGQWNILSIVKAKTEKEEIEEEETDSDKAPSKSISLPFSIKVFYRFVLENFQINIASENRPVLSAGVKNFTLRTHFLTNKFSTIPLDNSISRIIDIFTINVDPQKVIDVYFKNSASATSGPLDLHWYLALDNNKEKEFKSHLSVGNHILPVVYENSQPLPLNFSIGYKVDYDPVHDRFNLGYFKLSFLDDVWLKLEGKVDDASNSKKTMIKISLTESDIDLDKLFSLYRVISSDKTMKLKGHISLSPLYIEGPAGSLAVDGRINFKKIKYSMPGMYIEIPHFQLSYSILTNQQKTPVPIDFAKIAWKGEFNDAELGASFEYRPERKLYFSTFVNGFNPRQFIDNMVDGFFNLKFTVSGANEKHLKIETNINSPSFIYYLDRGRSGVNRLDIDSLAYVDVRDDKYEKIDVNLDHFEIKLKNKSHNNGVQFISSSKVSKTGDEIKVFFNLEKFAVNLHNLYPSLPESIQENMEVAAEKLKKNLILNGSTTIQKNGDDISVKHLTNMFVEDYEIDDIVLSSNIEKHSKTIDIDHLKLTGLNNSLLFDLKGKVVEKTVASKPSGKGDTEYETRMVPDVKMNFYFGKNKRERIFQNQTIEGAVSLIATLKENIAEGKFEIDHFYYDNGGFVRANNVNLFFPFRHDMLMQKSLNLKSANKERLIKGITKETKYNFTIDSLEIPHPTKVNQPFMLVYPGGDYPGLGATMLYQDNIFEIPSFQVFLLNGLITMQDFYFNVGKGDPSEMEYNLLLKVKNIDLKQLMPAEKAKTIKDGSISMDIMFNGSHLDAPLENLNGYVSVYKMGEEFAKQGVKIIIPDTSAIVDFSIDKGTIIQKMDFELQEGLVYARIFFTKGIVGKSVVSIAGNEILEERIPITEMFERTANEVKVYQLNTGNQHSTEANDE